MTVDEGLLLVLETSDPVALRTLLMQGFQLRLYGVKTDTVVVSFPSAKDVSDKITHHPGEVKATIQGEREKRPDMRPLVAALNKADVLVSRNGSNAKTLKGGHEVSINPANGMLTYSVMLPDDFVIEGGNTITLLSQPDTSMIENGEFVSRRNTNRSKDDRPQPFGVNAKDNPAHLRVIKIRFDFK